MLHRIAHEEELSDSNSFSSSNLSIPSSEFEQLDISSGRSMSSIFASDAGTSTAASSRASSPSRKRPSLSHKRTASQGSVDTQKAKDDHLARWLQYGNVIYKSVGLGLMDLTVGMHLIQFAKEKGVGSHIEGF